MILRGSRARKTRKEWETLGRRPISSSLLELVDVDDRVDRVQAPVDRALQEKALEVVMCRNKRSRRVLNRRVDL